MNILLIKTFFTTMVVTILAIFVSPEPNNTVVYPVPPVRDNSLFYIQRTKNTNAIVYETNYLPNGRINTKEPIKIYWIRYASDSTTAELTSIQRTYAYGVHVNQLKTENSSFIVQLVAYKKRSIFLMPISNGTRYAALMKINGKMAELKRIFVATSGGTFWFPKVDYIELSGKDPVTHLPVIERFQP
jgi:hypothetical protein